MDKQEFLLARQCFENAKLPVERDIAEAYLRLETAEDASGYSAAAEVFEACATKTSSVRAKKLYLTSATCYHRAGNFKASAMAYGEAREFIKCAEQYCKANMLEEARQVVLCHRNDVSDDIVKQIFLHFFYNERPYDILF